MACLITDLCIGCGLCKTVCPTSAIFGNKKELHLIDKNLCIECGACGRVCPKEAILDYDGNKITNLKKEFWLRPVIFTEKCFACENCVDSCPTGALSMKSESLPLSENYAILLNPEKCVSCGWCVDNCQFDAIKLEALHAVN